MRTELPLGEVLEAADQLPLADQETLLEVLHRRIIDRRRDVLMADIHEAEEDFEAGRCEPRTPEQIIEEIIE